MATTLKTFLDELIVVLRAVPGLAFVPDEPPEGIIQFPAAIVYVNNSRAELGPMNRVATYHHDINIAVLVGREHLPTSYQLAVPFIEPVTEAMLTALVVDKVFTDFDNFTEFTYQFGPIDWGGVQYIGYLITMLNAKYRRDF